MKRALILIATLLTLATNVAADSLWGKVLRNVQPSVMMLQSEDHACTAFAVTVIHRVTAAHCAKAGVLMSTDGEVLKVVKVDEKKDLALLESTHHRAPLSLGREPDYGDELMSVGMSPNGVVTIFSRVTSPSIGGLPYGDILLTQGWHLPGMSGGPIVDTEGKVVSVIQRSADRNLNVTVQFEDLKKFLKSVAD